MSTTRSKPVHDTSAALEGLQKQWTKIQHRVRQSARLDGIGLLSISDNPRGEQVAQTVRSEHHQDLRPVIEEEDVKHWPLPRSNFAIPPVDTFSGEAFVN